MTQIVVDKAVIEQALAALESAPVQYDFNSYPMLVMSPETIVTTLTALREALEQPVSQEPVQIAWQCAECKAPVRDGYTCDVCDSGLAEERYAEQPVSQEPVDGLARACNLAGIDYEDFLRIKSYMPVYTAPQPVNQEPVCCDKCGSKLGTTVVPCDCTAPQPVKEVELTDDEIDAFIDRAWDKQMSMPEIIRAVIAADREKNRG